MNNHLYYRTRFDSSWKHVRHSCCVKSIAQMKNGLIIGVGMRNRLWVRQSLFSKWSWMVPRSGSVTSITIGPRGQIIGVGLNKKLYVRKCLTSRWFGPLRNSGGVIDVKYGSGGYLYGVGTNKRYHITFFIANFLNSNITMVKLFKHWKNAANYLRACYGKLRPSECSLNSLMNVHYIQS